MLVLASFNGPSDLRCWIAFLGSIVLAAALGYLPRNPRQGFVFGGIAGACLTFVVLGSAKGDMVTIATIIATPIHALIAGLVGSFFGWIGQAKSDSKHSRPRIEDQNPFEIRDDSDSEEP